jgi:hypothetical protein
MATIASVIRERKPAHSKVTDKSANSQTNAPGSESGDRNRISLRSIGAHQHTAYSIATSNSLHSEASITVGVFTLAWYGDYS